MNKKHGMTGTRTFKSWSTMKQRCLNPNAPDYARFGGRGVGVCNRWLRFENFLSDMGMRPDGKTLDRIDVNKGYSPSNCKWSTHREQHRNRRNTRYAIVRGKKRPLIALAEKHGLKLSILVARLGSGWSLQKALSEPIMQGRGKKAAPR